MTTRWISTYKGHRLNPLVLTGNEVFDIEDIAHSLALQCRFTGHTATFYSVAQHSLLVSDLIYERMRGNPEDENDIDWKMVLAALLHDAEEAYLMDLARPLKRQPQMEFYVNAGTTLRRAIYKYYLLDPNLIDDEWIKETDDAVLCREAFAYVSATEEWGLGRPDYRIELGPPMTWQEAENRFLTAFESLWGHITHGLLPQSKDRTEARG